MQTAFRLAYGLAVAIFFILVVIFGSRTLYSEPNDRGFSHPYSLRNIYCNDDNRCYLDNREITDNNDPALTADEREFVRQQRDFYDDWDTYSRTVFIIAALLGVLAIAAGVALFRRVEGMPLGLVLGGIGAVIYGWGESSDGQGDVGPAPLFILATIGFVIVLAAGYWFLGGRERDPEAPSASGS
jgi:hypothetical protein